MTIAGNLVMLAGFELAVFGGGAMLLRGGH